MWLQFSRFALIAWLYFLFVTFIWNIYVGEIQFSHFIGKCLFMRNPEICFWRIFVFSLLLKFVQVLFISSCGRCQADFSFFLTTNLWPEYFRVTAIFLLNSVFDLRIVTLVLFLALVYIWWAFVSIWGI